MKTGYLRQYNKQCKENLQYNNILLKNKQMKKQEGKQWKYCIEAMPDINKYFLI